MTSAPTAPPARAVFITATEPEPRRYGKPVVIGGILDYLCDRLGPRNVHLILIGRPELQRPPVAYQRHVLAKPGSKDQALSALRRTVAPPPGAGRRSLQEAALFSPGLTRDIATALAGIGADLEIWDTVRMGQYVLEPGIGDPRPARRILYADDLFSERYQAMLDQPAQEGNPGGQFVELLPGPARRLLASPRVHRPLLRLEKTLVAGSELRQPAHFDATYLISPDETARLRARVPGARIGTLPPLLRAPQHSRREFTGAPEFTFLGGFDYAPNIDGMDWFLRTCRSATLSRLPGVVINVVGKGTERGLASAREWGTSVRFHGWVDDLESVLARSAALLSPLMSGSGVKIKVLEALARGLPVVATPPGVQGIASGPGSGCLVAADPESLAQAMLTAIDPATNQELSAAARRTWDRDYAAAVVEREYAEIFGI